MIVSMPALWGSGLETETVWIGNILVYMGFIYYNTRTILQLSGSITCLYCFHEFLNPA